MTFADEDKSDIPIRAVSQPDTTQTPQYQKKSLDTIDRTGVSSAES